MSTKQSWIQQELMIQLQEMNAKYLVCIFHEMHCILQADVCLPQSKYPLVVDSGSGYIKVGLTSDQEPQLVRNIAGQHVIGANGMEIISTNTINVNYRNASKWCNWELGLSYGFRIWQTWDIQAMGG